MKLFVLLFVLLFTFGAYAQDPWLTCYDGTEATNFYTVEDTTQLKLLNAPLGNAVMLKSIGATDDAYGGIFTVETSTATADLKNIFAHPNTSYRWMRAGSKDLFLQSTTVGSNVFTTTATADTVVISGALATDNYFITGTGGSVDQQDVLQAEAKADTLIVHRLASGASALTYDWLRIR